eukprot:jgi/Mesen1/7208/ME000371S06300
MAALSATAAVTGMFQKISVDSLNKSSFYSSTSTLAPSSLKAPLTFSHGPLTVEAAHKKGSGSTKNGRDSNAQRLGVKVYGDQPAKAGSIIIRQRGTKIHPGKNVGLGKDYTIFSLIDGLVKFEKYGPDKKKVSVYPAPEAVPENPNSRRVRRREVFRERREKRRAAFDEEFGYEASEPLISIASAPLESIAEETTIC